MTHEKAVPASGCVEAVLLDEARVRIDQKSTLIGGAWQGKTASGVPCPWDPDSIRFFYDRACAVKDPVILDIGANTGIYCLLPVINPHITGYAFEPNPTAYRLLQKNLCLNGLENHIRTMPIALSNRSGSVVLKIPASGVASGLANIGTPRRFDRWKEIEVPTDTLDSIAARREITKVDLIKIDTEGCELFVLLGGEQLIRRHHPGILVEFEERNTAQFGYHPDKIAELLSSWGYSFLKVSECDAYFYKKEARVCASPSGHARGRVRPDGLSSPSCSDRLQRPSTRAQDLTVSNERSIGGAGVLPGSSSESASVLRLAGQWIRTMADAGGRLYYRDQSSQTLASLARYARELDPTVIVELGTLAGLSLRAWIASTQQTKIYAVDFSFKTFNETKRLLPVDLSRVTLLEQDILKTDFPSLWTAQDRVIFFVDAHDLPGVPIMEYVLATALPSLPDGSIVIVDDLWFSPKRLTHDNAQAFLDSRVVGEIDELQCLEAYYAPYHAGGSFMGFAEVIPLLKFVNARGIPLMYEEEGKHVSFVWKSAYLSQHRAADAAEPTDCFGSVVHNPLTRVPVAPSLQETMCRIATDYQQRRIGPAAESLVSLIEQYPRDPGLTYGLAVCLARRGRLAEARGVLGRIIQDSNDPHCHRLFDDLVERVGPCPSEKPPTLTPRRQGGGLTIFAMPKPFVGHNGIIQKNAIRSWARLDPRPEIILFGDEPGIRDMAQEIGARHELNVERNEFGTPLVNKLFETAQNLASNRVLAYVNADMILFQDFAEGVQKVQTQLSRFLLIGQRCDLVVLDEIDVSQPGWQEALWRETEKHAMLHAECGLDYFVFPKGLYPEIPPFAIGRIAWDNWLVMAPHRYGVPVVDGTEFITAVHQDHGYEHVRGGRHEAWNGVEAARNRALAGQIDSSGCTSGASRALRRDGTLVEVSPRPPRYLTNIYRNQRSIWLLKQAERLIAAERRELAACKWEEALVLLEALLTLKRAGYDNSESLDESDLAGRFATCCIRLARCYRLMGKHEQVVTTCVRFLENPVVQPTLAQRDALVLLRNESVSALHRGVQPATTPMRQRLSLDRSEIHQTVESERFQEESQSRWVPALRTDGLAGDGGDRHPQQVLADLERKYRLLSSGTRGKYAMAVRLSNLFRRAGLMEKSRALELEAAALKSGHNIQSASHSTAGQRAEGRTIQMAVDCQAKVTVITACRNGQEYLSECLESLLGQTLTEWELFLIDDGSTDDTRRIIQDYARRDRRIKPCCFNDSAGLYVRRNFAIRQARSPFVVIQDGDDIMVPNKLQVLYEAISGDDRLGVVGSFYRKFLDEFRGLKPTEPVRLLITHEQILDAYQNQMLWDFAWHGSAIIRKRLFEAIGLYDENPFGAGSFWLAKAAEYARHTNRIRLSNIPEVLTLRRMHDKFQTGVLPPADPRGRRARYWRYCSGRLQQVSKRAQENPQLDIARALRECTCGDFLTRFRAQIPVWEAQPLDSRVLPFLLRRAVTHFNERQYVSCMCTLRDVETMEPATPRRVVHFNLLRAMALRGLGLEAESRQQLECELDQHNSPAARRFQEDYFQRGLRTEVRQWCAENAERCNLGLIESENEESPGLRAGTNAGYAQNATL